MNLPTLRRSFLSYPASWLMSALNGTNRANMFIAALMSLSWVALHLEHVHVRTLRGYTISVPT
ncbi:MAG: hypothetical protein R2865_12905 [Deinococcales bacterium]